jgi:hypothetical protein
MKAKGAEEEKGTIHMMRLWMDAHRGHHDVWMDGSSASASASAHRERQFGKLKRRSLLVGSIFLILSACVRVATRLSISRPATDAAMY